jgi:hypothetical protein
MIGPSNILARGGEGAFVLVVFIVGASSSPRSIVTSNFDNSTFPELCSSRLPSRPVRGREKLIKDCRRGTTPTLLPAAEYIVPSGVVSESLKKALARTVKLQTRRESQSYKVGKSAEGDQQEGTAQLKGRSKLKAGEGLKSRKENDVPRNELQ